MDIREGEPVKWVQQVIAATLDTGLLIIELAQQHGPNGLPLGPTYAKMMDFLTLDSFMRIVLFLKETKLIRVEHNCIYYAGPPEETKITPPEDITRT
jgi:hypothetical protein